MNLLEMKRPKRAYKKGLVRDSKILGVHWSHLWRVINGQRESKSLMNRYNALKIKSVTPQPLPKKSHE